MIGNAARRVLIGVHLTAASQDPAATLAAIHEATAPPFAVVLLVDPGPGEGTALALVLEALRDIPQVTAPGPGGAPAAFNALVAMPGDVHVFLEAGARPGPDWLAWLLAALDADPAHGLAGPSTNDGWNEQAVAPGCGGSSAEVAQQAALLAQRHAGAWSSMAPLHSLSDFCLAVTRETVRAVGAAEVAYGRNPCWEMDYAARAARAGFASVWAQSAFVRRGPMPAWRAASEIARLQVGKRLYQDRLCGLRLEAGGRDLPYHDHCGGEACEAFAPPDRIRIHRPLPRAAPRYAHTPPGQPLISCCMPTRGRPHFVAQAVEYFRRQDYPNRELVIVYEHETDLPPGLAAPDIRTVRAAAPSIGAKREQAVRHAWGELVVHWDDDDWYSPQRLSRQAAPILQGLADISGLNDVLFMTLREGEFWAVTRSLFRRLFVENISGSTLMFRRAFWEKAGPYPSVSLREDVEMMGAMMAEGARLVRLPGRDLCVYVRHPHNTWKFAEGRHLQPGDWSRVPAPGFMEADQEFYAALRTVQPRPVAAAPAPRAAASGLVSCIMPTWNRRAFVPAAIRQFLAQDYQDSELIVLDDGTDRVADLMPASDRVRYHRLDRRIPVGTKRNMACELARGDIVVHWDDDDWRAPRFITAQVRSLADHDADVGGLDTVYFYAPDTRQGWRYVYDGPQAWVFGGALCYRRDYWMRAPFQEIGMGEDNAFVWSPAPKRLAVNPRTDLFVATVHRQNTSPKMTSGRRWKPMAAGVVEGLMGIPSSPEATASGGGKKAALTRLRRRHPPWLHIP